VKQILVIVALLAGCAGGIKQTTIRGVDLYAHASELRETGKALVPSSREPITVRANQYLVDRSQNQIFFVRDVVAGCFGGTLAEDTDCTAALMRDQRFVVVDDAPTPRDTREVKDLSDLDKARLVVAAAGVAMAVGAAKCDAFAGCGTLLGLGAGVDALLLLVMFTGLK
jgi:hypothetical protein